MPDRSAKLLAAFAAFSFLFLGCICTPAFAQTWETKAPMPGGGRAAAGVGTLNGLLYAVGGFSNPFCGGHASAVGLRFYFDATNRATRFGETLTQ